ncbi:MAG: hypothetical protein K0Q93_922 [Nocardioidaceae bacterium]|jgi:hypothetical protein|nr:hypothetical protein [Nocardioidaceae bacterium]
MRQVCIVVLMLGTFVAVMWIAREDRQEHENR